MACDFLTDPCDRCVQMLNLLERFAEHEAMMGRHLSRECALHVLLTGTQQSHGKSSQSCRLRFPLDESREDHAGGFAHHRASDITQLEVRVFPRLLQAIDFAGSFFHQFRPIPCQFADFPLPSRRNETGAEQSMGEQIGDPLRVLDIGVG